MKIALVHDFLVQDGGAERVLKVLAEMFPSAPIYTLLYQADKVDGFFKSRKIHTSFLQNSFLAKGNYRLLLKKMPEAVEEFYLSGYDLVISSASAFAKGVKTKAPTKHICYCHTPTRYLWSDRESYVKELPYHPWIKKFIPLILDKLKVWDITAAQRPDYYLANSHLVQARIKEYYGRDSQVIYPPVDCASFFIRDGFKDYFLAGGRLVAYKKFDLVIKVFNRLGWPLKIFGLGPELAKLKNLADVNIEFLGYVSASRLRELYANAKAFVHPQVEDFGLVAVEAQSSGRPVIAYKVGGASETVASGKTGILFAEQKENSMAEAIKKFREEDFKPAEIREHALKFDRSVFEREIKKFIDYVVSNN